MDGSWILEAATTTVGKVATNARRLNHEGGYTKAFRRVIEFSDGSSCFVKASTSKQTAEWIRNESSVYQRWVAPFLPEYLGSYDDGGERSALFIENLESAVWPEVANNDQIVLITQVLETLRTMPAPDWLERNKDTENAVINAWQDVVAQPNQFESLGAASTTWLDKNIDALLELSADSVTDGDNPIHLDIRSDNICFVNDRVYIVDWNYLSRGNPWIDQHYWAVTHAAQSQTYPDELLGPNANEQIAMMAGYFAKAAIANGQPLATTESDDNTDAIKQLQISTLRAAINWLARRGVVGDPEM